MFYNLLTNPDLGKIISLGITAGFVFAFIFAYKNWRNNSSVFILSSVLFVNFVLANNALYDFVTTQTKQDILNYYINWVQYNSLSIIVIVGFHLYLKIKIHKITEYSMYLLLINIGFYMAMHVDIMINGNREPWLLWNMYTPVVNTTEISLFLLISIFSVYSKSAITRNAVGNT